MNADFVKRHSAILLILFFIPLLLNAELLPELRRQVIAFIHSPYLEFPEGYNEPLLGQQIAELVNEFKTPGSFSFEFDGTNLASGVYFYRIEAGTFTDSKKMVLIK